MLFVGDNEPIEKKLAPPLPFRTLVKTFKYDESNDNTVLFFFSHSFISAHEAVYFRKN